MSREGPFPGHLEQRITLGEDGLEWSLEIHADEAPFPASLGWHPWFRRQLSRGKPARLIFDAGKVYATGEDTLPTGVLAEPGPGPWDDCFIDVADDPSISWPGALELFLSADVDHWVVYDKPMDALCVEPWSGPPYALNIAPRRVEPGQPLCATLQMRWSVDSSDPPPAS